VVCKLNVFCLLGHVQVGDRCGECEDEHIDVLLDRPFAYAPYSPDNAAENTNAKYANSLPGPRGFANPWSMRGGSTFSPEAVGTWVSDWQWVPCESFTHTSCAQLMTKMGYTNVWTPMATPGELMSRSTLRSYPMRLLLLLLLLLPLLQGLASCI
jgi:hypothetical protein